MSRFAWLGPAIGIMLVIFAVGLRHLLASPDVDRAADGLWSRLSWTGIVVQFAAAAVVVRSTVLPTWTGVVAALAAPATPVGGLWIVVDGDPAGPVAGISFIAGLAFIVFVPATSVTMLRQRTTLTT